MEGTRWWWRFLARMAAHHRTSMKKKQIESVNYRAFSSNTERTFWLRFLMEMAANHRAGRRKKSGASSPLSRPLNWRFFPQISPPREVRFLKQSSPFKGLRFQPHGGGRGRLLPQKPPFLPQHSAPQGLRLSLNEQVPMGSIFIEEDRQNSKGFSSPTGSSFSALMDAARSPQGEHIALHVLQVPDPWRFSMNTKKKEGSSPSQWRFPCSVVSPTVELKHVSFTFSFAEGHPPNMKKDPHDEQPARWLHYLRRRQQHRKVIFQGLRPRCRFRSPYNEEGHADRPFSSGTSS